MKILGLVIRTQTDSKLSDSYYTRKTLATPVSLYHLPSKHIRMIYGALIVRNQNGHQLFCHEFARIL